MDKEIVKAEIEKKKLEIKQLEEKLKDSEIPYPQIPYVVSNFDNLVEVCKERIEEISKGEGDSSAKQWIYEAAMIAVYGKDIFEWTNSQDI